jgi:hypothetical protein
MAPRNVVTLSNVPVELHEWFKRLAAQETEKQGKRITFCDLVVEAMEEYKADHQDGSGDGPNGHYEYYLKDGQGPFKDIQSAMDALGMDRDDRPHHNRWGRLSEDLKAKIERRPRPAEVAHVTN